MCLWETMVPVTEAFTSVELCSVIKIFIVCGSILPGIAPESNILTEDAIGGQVNAKR